jgi:hypothetical protein
MVQEKIPIDKQNFIGLCQILAPNSIRSSENERINKIKKVTKLSNPNQPNDLLLLNISLIICINERDFD